MEEGREGLRDSIYVWLPDLRGGECLRRAKDGWDEETYARDPEVVALALTALGLNSWEELLTLFRDEKLGDWMAPNPAETLPDACFQAFDSFERHFIPHIERNPLVPPLQLQRLNQEPTEAIQCLGEIWPTWSQGMWNGDFRREFRHGTTAARDERARLTVATARSRLEPYGCLPFEEEYWPETDAQDPLSEPRLPDTAVLEEYVLILKAISAARAAVRHKIAEYGLLYLPAVFDLCTRKPDSSYVSIESATLWDDSDIETKLPGYKTWWRTRAVRITASHKLTVSQLGKQWTRFELDGSSGPARFEFTNSTVSEDKYGEPHHSARLTVQMPSQQPAVWANVFKASSGKRKVMVAEVVKEISRGLGIVEFGWDWKRLVMFLTCVGVSLCDPNDIGFQGFCWRL
ncbi:hypothetical protein HKX48_000251 [Thoreauomyces humboldtii]|nr:hypothetical protein HKX48_000251 [Thoreauomyces humboldtii]